MATKRERYLLEDILIVLFKHKFKIIAAFLTVMVAVTIKTSMTTPVYETRSSLMVQSGRESLYRPEVGDDAERVILNLDALISTETQILTSADLIEEVITDLGVENIYPDMIDPSRQGPAPEKKALIKGATFRFKGNLAANPVKGSNVINVAFKHNDPQLAAQAVNQLIESFKLKHIEIFKNPRTDFMEKQLAVYRQRLQESEKNLEAFKQKNGVFSLSEQKSLLLNQRSTLDISSKEAQRQAQELQQEISFITSQMQSIPKYELATSETGKNKNIHDAQEKLLDLRILENELLTKFTPSNRQISKVRTEIQLIEDYLANNGLKEVSEREVLAKNSTYANLEGSLLKAQSSLSAQEAAIATLEKQLKHVNDEIQGLDAHERELRKLERELTTEESNFENYVTKLEDARIEEELDLMRKVNIAVIQKATVPLGPVEPRKRFNLLVGIILGLVSGLALAIFSEYCIGRGVCTPESVEQHLGLPILATVPYKEKNSRVVFTMVSVASLFLLLLILNACSTAVKSPTPFNPRVVQEPSDSIKEYVINNNDKLDIKFYYNNELNETVSVRPDGMISLQLVGNVMAAGLTTSELTDLLKEKYSAEIIDPNITVLVRTYTNNKVFVDGEVSKPQMFSLDNGSITVSQSIALAGGLRDTARRNEVRVIRRKADKKPLVIPVNLNEVWNGTNISQDIALQPYDIVYVPKSSIANVNLWVNQYIYNNFRIGFGYSIDEFFWE